MGKFYFNEKKFNWEWKFLNDNNIMWVMGGDFLMNERIMIKWVRKILNEKNK